MKVAIDALGVHVYGGGRTATVNLLQALLALDHENEYLLFLTQSEPKLEASNATQIVIPIKNRFLSRIWAQISIPRLSRDCNVVHFMKNLSVFGIQKPIVVTIYDMTTLLHPNLFPVLDVWYWQYIQRRMLRQASRVIAISKQTARDLKSFYDLPTNRIQVITPSCAPHFCPATLGKVKSVRKRYELPEYYILHVGRIDPKKNIPLLIEAFARFRQQTGFSGALVLVGEQYKKRPDRSIYDVISSLNLDDVVLLLGAVADDDLPAIYTGATISVFPSVHEGFGLVALEALACGAPLIVNKAGAVTDVVGNAALVMPSSTSESLASLLTELWNDSEKRAFLRTSGLQRAKVFSWSESARQTLAVYKEVAK